MNALQKASFGLVAVAASTQSAFAAITPKAPSEGLVGNNGGLVDIIQNIISYLTTFLYIIAVAYAIYGGFLMLTSGGDDANVKKGKTILMHGAMGILVIFLASSVIKFVLEVVVR